MDLKALMQKLAAINTQHIVTESVETKQVITESAVPVRQSAELVFKSSIARSLAEEFGYALDEAPEDPVNTTGAAANDKKMQADRIASDAAKGNVQSANGPIPAAATATRPAAAPAPASPAATSPAVKNPYQGADAAKFAAMSPADQAWLTKGGGQPDINDQFILARAPNKGAAVAKPAPAAIAPGVAGSTNATAAADNSGNVAGGQAASPAQPTAPTGTQAQGDDDGNTMITKPDGTTMVVGPDGNAIKPGTNPALATNKAQAAAIASGAQDDATGVDAAVAANAAKPATSTEPAAAKPKVMAKSDPAVMKIQQDLIAQGAPIKADGVMGDATRKAMQQFPGVAGTSAAKPAGAPTAGAPKSSYAKPAPAPTAAAPVTAAPSMMDRFKSAVGLSTSGQPAAAPAAAPVAAPAGEKLSPQQILAQKNIARAQAKAAQVAPDGNGSGTLQGGQVKPVPESIVTQDDAILAMIRNIRVG